MKSTQQLWQVLKELGIGLKIQSLYAEAHFGQHAQRTYCKVSLKAKPDLATYWNLYGKETIPPNIGLINAWR